jgi:hypothetical protein
MKTNTEKNTKTGLLSRPEPVGPNRKPIARTPIDFSRRKANRSLDTAKLLALLESDAPKFFETAEVVGKWVWIEFTEKQPAAVTRVLSEFGFHWNNVRKAWQHPCGRYRDQHATYDPRHRYGSYFPAAVKPS